MGSPMGADRLARVHAWVAARAGDLGEPVTIGLLCETAVTRLGVSGATVTMGTGRGWPETRCSTDMLGERLADLHLTVGEGPNADASRAGGPVLVADLDSPESQRRWPLFAPLAVEAGARALFAFPLVIGAIRAGMLTVHRTYQGPLDATALPTALAFARMALGLVLGLVLDEQTGRRDGDGALPLHNPHLHQATGMISAQLDVGVDDAFARLRGRAFATQRSLADLAADVVARRVRFVPDPETT